MQVSVARDPNLHLVDVVFKRRGTGVVDVEKIRVEIDVHAISCFDRGPGTILDEEMVGDGREDRSGWKRDQRGGVGGESVRDMMDFDKSGMAGLLPGGILGADSHSVSILGSLIVLHWTLLVNTSGRNPKPMLNTV